MLNNSASNIINKLQIESQKLFVFPSDIITMINLLNTSIMIYQILNAVIFAVVIMNSLMNS